jgi:hypothetical protein
MHIRRACPADIPHLLRLNNASVPFVNALEEARMEHFLKVCTFFQAAVNEENVPIGFLSAMEPETVYDSLNFLWFKERYPEFLYIDRVTVDSSYKRRGIGRALYAELIAFAQEHYPYLACEVNTKPRNEASLRFHEGLGFSAVGTLGDEDGGGKVVSMLLKPLSAGRGIRVEAQGAADRREAPASDSETESHRPAVGGGAPRGLPR